MKIGVASSVKCSQECYNNSEVSSTISVQEVIGDYNETNCK